MRDLAFDHWGDLLLMVVKENDAQLSKWGYQNHDPFKWMVFLTEEVGELAAEIADNVWDRKGATNATVAEEAIQVATLALKIAEMHLYRRQSEAPVEGQICHQCKMENDPDEADCLMCQSEEEI